MNTNVCISGNISLTKDFTFKYLFFDRFNGRVPMINNIKIDTALTDMCSKLITEGKERYVVEFRTFILKACRKFI